MVEKSSKPAAKRQEKSVEELQTLGRVGSAGERDLHVSGEARGFAPEPKHGDPTAYAPPAPGETVLGVRVGSEAAVESGVGPVLPPSQGGARAFTKVMNKDLVERDRKEFLKRGMSADGQQATGVAVSVSFEGPMIVERGKNLDPVLVSGSYSGTIPPEGLLIRPLTVEEQKRYFPTPADAAAGKGGTTTRS